MKKFLCICVFVLISAVLFASGQGEAGETATDSQIEAAEYGRIISLGGTVTEIAYALGLEDRIIAVDDSSLYPERALAEKPSVGYVRFLSAENILSLEPDLIVASADAGPADVVQQIEASGVALRQFGLEDSPESTEQAIRDIAAFFGLDDKAEVLVQTMYAELSDAESHIDPEVVPSVAFVYARGAGTMMVAGTETSANAMISLAGGQNVVTEYSGYKPLTNEALVAGDPDVLLFTAGGLASLGGIDGLKQIPALAELSAVQNGSVYAMDDLLLLGFGPRLGQAVNELASYIHQ